MYRIAICDDDEAFLHHLGRATEEILTASGLVRGSDFGIDLFSQAAQVQSRVLEDKDSYSLLLLDIEISRENGMELARTLREQQVKCSIIFITSHRDYIFDCFDTRPLWYLLKPVDLEKYKEILLSDYRRNYAGARLALKVGGRQLAILYQDIYALESTQHHARIWLADSYQDWNGALSALKPQLPPVSFCQSHNSYLVNLSHVNEIQRTDVLMDNGKKFPISRRYHDQVMERYFAYLKL
ncbi:LytR/AlgR family response regulator transcription factor [Murimonas intestini]|uniref:LytR/AlgR family response regulator transcription factor n=1 Tax=Murimonas intestini TaxID=1337051 RepID=UPI0011DE4A74|nr:LytTR family DNA-binding domain-containing protein [Murimonas intestini]